MSLTLAIASLTIISASYYLMCVISLKASYLCLLSRAETLVLEFEVVHAVVDLETEEVIEDSIGR